MKQKFKEKVLIPTMDKTRLNRINQFLANDYIVPVLVILMDLLILSLINFIINAGFELITSGISGYVFSLLDFFIPIRLLLTSKTIRLLYIFTLLFIAIIDAMFVYQIKTAFAEEVLNVGQKGKSRFITIDEIKQQYKEIPDRDVEYPGKPGTIISRYEKKLYIDTSPTNNIIIGITRSGKGEFFVYPSIDVYSRAEEKASMVILDPKSELYRSAKETLEKRGYSVYFLNLIDPLCSMGYNPLQLVVDYYKQKLYDKAELMSDSFAYSVFSPDKAGSSGNEKFFDKTASGVFSALILSIVNDCLYEDELLNAKRYEVYQRKVQAYKELLEKDGAEKEKLHQEYYQLKAECRKNDEDEFLSVKIGYIPESEEFYYIDKYEKCINAYSILNLVVELSQILIPNTNDTALDEFFRVRPQMDPGKMRYAAALVAGDRTKGSILSNLMQGLDVFQSRAIAKMTAESSLDFKEVGFGDNPVAVFMGIPDYDSSKHFLAVVFIRQLYYYLAETCSRTVGKCKRHVKFICDEFGNMPAVDDMGSMITVCLGRNISFDLYIQDYSQLQIKYGDAAKTIQSNCGNHIYILGNEEETAKTISHDLGTKTRINLQRSGEKLSLKKTLTETTDDEPLLDPNQLMRLREGECVILRSMKRKDLKGNDIYPFPIFNSIETGTRFLYRHQYLQDSFPNPDEIDLRMINKESRMHIDQSKRIWDYQLSFARYEATKEKIIRFCELSDNIKEQTISLLRKNMGTDLEVYGITEESDISLAKLISIINEYPYMDQYDKQSVMGVLKNIKM